MGYVVGLVSEKEAKRKEEIAKEKRFTKNIITTVPDSLLVLDADLRIKKANLSFYEKFQTEHEEVIGSSIADILHDKDKKLSTELTKLFGSEDMLENFELHYQSEKLGERIFNITARGMLVAEEEEEEEEEIEDITRRKRAEEALTETKEYLDSIIKSSADAIVVVDMEGIVRDWNKAAEDYLGYTADEVIGTSNKKFFADAEEPDRIMELVQREEAIKNYRTSVLREDGEPVHISMSAALLKDKDGVPIGTVRVSRDITKEVELEEQVKEERDNLNSIFETMTDGVYVVSKDYEIEFMNNVLKNEHGDQVGGICYKVFHGREEPFPLCKQSEVMKGETIRWEWVSRRANKTYDLIETPLKNVDGTISKLTIFRDITERKRAEEALAASKAHTESIIQNFLDTLIVVDTEAKIQTVNPATCELLGYTEEELIGQPISIIFAEEERFFQFFREPEKAEALRPQDTIRNRELTYKTKDGRLIPMSFNASVLTDEAGNVTHVVAGAKDITELKLAEAEIRKEKSFSENIVS